MTNRLDSRLALCFSTVVALAAFACSSATPDLGSSGGDGTGTKTPATNPTTSPTAAPTSTGTTPGNPTTPPSSSAAAACGAKTTGQDCSDCCYALDMADADAADKVGQDCICAATTCQTACADSICAAADNMNQPTAACQTCLDTNGPTCDAKASAACAATGCKAVDACDAMYCAKFSDAGP